ncbi:hypothetical protein KM043_010301 [Ampulex compressa]|nr:hypothetical protein KM043_010301 [Ampulex compressa]
MAVRAHELRGTKAWHWVSSWMHRPSLRESSLVGFSVRQAKFRVFSFGSTTASSLCPYPFENALPEREQPTLVARKAPKCYSTCMLDETAYLEARSIERLPLFEMKRLLRY